MSHRGLGRAVVVASLAVIAIATLRPAAGGVPHQVDWCLWCDDRAGVDFMFNALLFAPLGVGLRLTGLSRWRSIAVAAATSSTVELLQYLAVPGRVASIDDVVSNTAGGWLGVMVGGCARPLLLPTVEEARRLVVAAVLGWLAVLGLTLWLFAPALPRRPYEVWVAPDRGPVPGRFDRFTGRVLTARVGATPLWRGRVGDSRALRTVLMRDRMPVTAIVTSPRETPERLAVIVAAFDTEGHELFVLGQEGANLIFRLRRRSSVVRLQTPDDVVWNVFAPGAGSAHDTVVLAAWTDGYWLRLRADRAGIRSERDLAFRPTWGWTLVLPFENTLGPQTRTFTAEWVALVLLPAGFYGAVTVWPSRDRSGGRAPHRSSGGRAWWPAVLVPAGIWGALIAGLVALPASIGLPAPPPWEWHGALVGIAGGAIAGCVSAWLRARTAQLPT